MLTTGTLTSFPCKFCQLLFLFWASIGGLVAALPGQELTSLLAWKCAIRTHGHSGLCHTLHAGATVAEMEQQAASLCDLRHKLLPILSHQEALALGTASQNVSCGAPCRGADGGSGQAALQAALVQLRLQAASSQHVEVCYGATLGPHGKHHSCKHCVLFFWLGECQCGSCVGLWVHLCLLRSPATSRAGFLCSADRSGLGVAISGQWLKCANLARKCSKIRHFTGPDEKLKRTSNNCTSIDPR